MTKIDIFSGFLGAGKTTLIKKLLKEAMNSEQVVLIENEFGEIGVDGGFLKEAGIEIKEMNSGCICCSLVGDFGTSLKEVLTQYKPDRILIEPSGVGKLSDVMKAVKNAIDEHDVVLNSAVAVVDASKAKMYIKNFGEFFVNQIEHAGTIILSRTQNLDKAKLDAAIALIREHNPKATIITTPWDDIEGKDILDTIEGAKDLEKELMEELAHHHDDEDEHSITTIITTTTMMMTRTSTSIITITTTMTTKTTMMMTNTSIITTTMMTTMMMTNMSTIIMSMTRTAPVDAMIIITTIIMMQMRYSQAGEWRQQPHIPRLRSRIYFLSLMMKKNMVSY